MSKLNDEFEDFTKKVYKDVDSMPEKKKQLRLAFYAGAISCLHVMTQAAQESSPDSAKETMNGIVDECGRIITQFSIELQLKRLLEPLAPVTPEVEHKQE